MELVEVEEDWLEEPKAWERVNWRTASMLTREALRMVCMVGPANVQAFMAECT